MTNIGKYKVEAEIGRGGFGRVYKAFDPSVGRMVAVKVLVAEEDQGLLMRFRREANATGKLQHRNIVTIYEYGEHDNTPYIVMEYLEGEDLQAVLSSGRPMTLLEKTSIMSQVADGLHHAHQYGIVHRDIKPANIMILTDGSVKIMDFGIARLVRERTTRLTQHGDILGTLSYMAPEVFQGSEVDHLCDIFSYGVIYYELLAGKNPFSSEEPGRIIYNITSVEPPFLGALVRDCPPGLDQLISRAMHKDRELRYQSLEDVLFDLMPIRLQLQSAEAQRLIRKAETLITSRNIREAQTVVRQVLQLDPNNTTARELRERINREAQLQATRERCKQMLTAAQEQFAAEKYSECIETLQAALRLDSDDAEAQALLDKAKTAARKRERAEALLAAARRELGAAHLTDAYRSILECFQYAPENKEAAELLKAIRSAIEERERQRRLDETFSRADSLIAAEKLEEAENVLSDLELADPGNARVKEQLAKVRATIHERNRRRYLEEKLHNARDLMSRLSWPEAIRLLDELLREFPGETEVRSLSEHAKEQLKAQQKAEDIDRILREAQAASGKQDFQGALNLLHQGLKKYRGENVLEGALARTQDAFTEFQRQAAIKAATTRVNALAAQNQFAQALAEIDATLERWKSSELVELRARIVSQREAYDRAQAIAQLSASVKALIEKQKYQEAITAARDGLAKFSGDAGLASLLSAAEKGLEEQRRKARIQEAHDKAAAAGARADFGVALDLVGSALKEFKDEPSLVQLQRRLTQDLKEHERRQALAAAAAGVQQLFDGGDFEAAVRAGGVALQKFPKDPTLTALKQKAESALAARKRAEKIASVRNDAEAAAQRKDFNGALQLIRQTIRDVGADASLQELEQNVESLRRDHERRQAIESAAARAKELLGRSHARDAVNVLEKAVQEFAGEKQLEALLAEARAMLDAQQRSEAIETIVRNARELVNARDFQAALNIVRSGAQEYSADPRLTLMSSEIKAAMVEVEKQRAVKTALKSAAELQEQGQFSRAAEILEQVLVKVPGQAEVQEELARIAVRIQRQKEVNAALDKVCALMARSRFDEAFAAAHKALEQYPGEAALVALLDEVKKSRNVHAAAAACQKVEALRASGKLKEAVQLADKFLAEMPEEQTLTALRTRCQNELDEQQRRARAKTLAAEGRALLDKQKVEEAVAKLNAALQDCPGDLELTTLLAYANEVLSARRRADALTEAVKKGKALLKNQRPRECEKFVVEALSQFPGEQSLLLLLQRAQEQTAILDRQERIAEVLAAAEQHRKAKQYDRANELLEEALRQNPGEAALEQARTAVAAERTAHARATIIAEVHADAGKRRYASAISRVERGLTVFPGDAEMQALLGQLRETQAAEAAKAALRPSLAKQLTRPSVALAAGALLLVVLAGFFIWNSTSDVTETPAATPPAVAAEPRAPRILQFYAQPASVAAGGRVTICYGAENADRIRVEPIGDVPLAPSRCFEYQPQATADYRLTAVGASGEEVSENLTITVETGGAAALGQLLIQTGQSETNVFIGSRTYRTSPQGTLEVRLEPGTYDVSVEKPGFDTSPNQRIRLTAGQSQRANFRLTARPTLLVFSGAPAGASVLVDNSPTATIPANGTASIPVSAGQHRIELRRDGFQNRVLNVEVEQGERHQISPEEVALIPVPPPAAPEVRPTPPPTPAAPVVSAAARAWEGLVNSSDLTRLEQFRTQYPNTPEAESARQRIESLRGALERAEWDSVDRQNVAALRAFIQKYPNSANARQAQQDITRIEAQQRLRADTQSIQTALGQYARAFQNKDIQGLRAVYPSMPANFERGIQDIFRATSRITYEFRMAGEPSINGDRATVAVRAVYVYESRGRESRFDDPYSVVLQRQGSGWIIVSLNGS